MRQGQSTARVRKRATVRRVLRPPMNPRDKAIGALTTRASPAGLVAPAPDAAALDRMLRAAVRAPDHGRLRPWHFIVVDGAARAALGEILADALHRRDSAITEVALAKERAKP